MAKQSALSPREKLLLIDGDIIAYRSAFAAEKTKYLVTPSDTVALDDSFYDDAKSAKEEAARIGGLIWSRKEAAPEDQAIFIADTMIRDILARYSDEDFKRARVFITGVGNFRHGIATRATYKGNRAGATPPVHLGAVRSHLIRSWDAVCSRGEEADDLIGIAMTENPESICCSIDKDLKQLPGRHYDFAKKEESVVSVKEASLNFWVQVIAGDPTDNVPGLEGYGPVKARKALEGAKNTEDCYLRSWNLYKERYGEGGFGHMIETAQLVYVRRKVGDNWHVPLLKASTGPSTKSAGVCRECGASIPHRPGEGRCPECAHHVS